MYWVERGSWAGVLEVLDVVLKVLRPVLASVQQKCPHGLRHVLHANNAQHSTAQTQASYSMHHTTLHHTHPWQCFMYPAQTITHTYLFCAHISGVLPIVKGCVSPANRTSRDRNGVKIRNNQLMYHTSNSIVCEATGV
jgi:hypothetical protein